MNPHPPVTSHRQPTRSEVTSVHCVSQPCSLVKTFPPTSPLARDPMKIWNSLAYGERLGDGLSAMTPSESMRFSNNSP